LEQQDNPLLLRIKQEAKIFKEMLIYQEIMSWTDSKIKSFQTDCEKTSLGTPEGAARLSHQQGRLAQARKFKDIITQLTETGVIKDS